MFGCAAIKLFKTKDRTLNMNMFNVLSFVLKQKTTLNMKMFNVLSFVLKSFIVYCQINSDDDQRQLVEILVLALISIKLKYVSKSTLYNYRTCCSSGGNVVVQQNYYCGNSSFPYYLLTASYCCVYVYLVIFCLFYNYEYPFLLFITFLIIQQFK